MNLTSSEHRLHGPFARRDVLLLSFRCRVSGAFKNIVNHVYRSEEGKKHKDTTTKYVCSIRGNASQWKSTTVNAGQRRSTTLSRMSTQRSRGCSRPAQITSTRGLKYTNLVLFHEMKAEYRGERRRRWGGYYHIIRMPERRVREDSDALEPT